MGLLATGLQLTSHCREVAGWWFSQQALCMESVSSLCLCVWSFLVPLSYYKDVHVWVKLASVVSVGGCFSLRCAPGWLVLALATYDPDYNISGCRKWVYFLVLQIFKCMDLTTQQAPKGWYNTHTHQRCYVCSFRSPCFGYLFTCWKNRIMFVTRYSNVSISIACLSLYLKMSSLPSFFSFSQTVKSQLIKAVQIWLDFFLRWYRLC